MPPGTHRPARASRTSAGCPTAHDVQALVEGALGPAEAARFEVHIDTCDACRALIAELGRLAVGSHPRPVTGASDGAISLPAIGTMVDRYRIVSCLGAGGMGVVFAAHDAELDRVIALKLVHAGDGSADTGARSRVLREAKAIAKLSHPNVIAVYDAGTYEGSVFLAMELAEGGSVRSVLSGRRHGWREVLALYLDAGRGLAAAHAAGLVHRDFKPDNVLVGKDGHARVADFGLARACAELDVVTPSLVARDGEFAMAATLTKTGLIVGTPAYMPPEQTRGEPPDARSDVFAFCVALYEGLYGERPFDGKTLLELRANVEAERVRPEPPGADVPAWLRAALLRGLRAKAEGRYRTMDALLAALEPPRRAVRLAAASLGTAALVALAAYGVARDSARARRGSAAESAPGDAAAPRAADFVVASRPTRLTDLGLCAGLPTFGDDGSLVFAVHDDPKFSIYRMASGSNEAQPLVVGDGENTTPAPGGPGRAFYVHATHGSDASELWSVPLEGGPPRQEMRRADYAWQAGGYIFYVRDDATAIRRRALDGSVDEVLFEAPSAMTFLSIAVSADGSRLAAILTGIEWRPRTRVCYGEATPGAKLDCDTAGTTTATRLAFSPTGRALYFADGGAVVRFDVAEGARTTIALGAPEGDDGGEGLKPASMAVAPDESRLVVSSCKTRYEVARVADDGTLTPLLAASVARGTVAVAPHGAAAFPVVAGDSLALAITDDEGGRIRVLSGGDHMVTEAAISPDGAYAIFHDISPGAGGLFLVDTQSDHAPRRLTTDPEDSAPVWIDADHVAFLHPEKGYQYGRTYVAAIAGGEQRALPPLPGILFGSIPARGSLLLLDSRSSGDRFIEWTRDGATKPLRVDGVAGKLTVDRFIATSPSGGYVTWFTGNGGYRLDVVSGKATFVPFPALPGYAQTLQADDLGRLTLSYRYTKGQLYEVRGKFR